MQLTQEERNLIRQNLMSVYEWLKQHNSKIRDSVEFQIDRSVRFYMNPNSEPCVMTGNLTLYFVGKETSTTALLGNWSEEALKFLNSWQSIKARLLQQIENEHSQLESLVNFQV